MLHGRNKRQKELARAEHQREKEARKEARKREKEEQSQNKQDGVDPDIAHIVPGPQPLPEQ